MPKSAIAGLWALLLLFQAQAATLERLSLIDMIGKSTAIVRGRVVGAYASLRGSVVYTHYKVQILKQWKGQDCSFVEVLVPGGSTGNIRQSFSGVPNLIDGKEYLLYLWTGKSGVTHVTGFTQGVFDVVKGSGGELIAMRAASTETMLEPGTERIIKDEAVAMPLSEMSARISATLAKGAAK